MSLVGVVQLALSFVWISENKGDGLGTVGYSQEGKGMTKASLNCPRDSQLYPAAFS